MPINAVFDPYNDNPSQFPRNTNPAVLVDKMVGTSYDVVKHVCQYMEQVRHVSANLESVYRVSTDLEELKLLSDSLDELMTIVDNLDDLLQNTQLMYDNLAEFTASSPVTSVTTALVGSSVLVAETGGIIQTANLRTWNPENGEFDFRLAASPSAIASDFAGVFEEFVTDCSTRNWLGKIGKSVDPYEVMLVDVTVPGDLRLDLSGSRFVGKTDFQQFVVLPGQTAFTLNAWPYAANGTSAIVVNPATGEYTVLTQGVNYTITGQVVTLSVAPTTGHILYIGQRSAAINLASATRSRLLLRGGNLDLSNRGYIETQASGSGFRLAGWGATFWDGSPRIFNNSGRYFNEILTRRSDAAIVVNDSQNTEIHGLIALGMCDAAVYATGGSNVGISTDDGFGLKLIGGMATRCNIDAKDTRQGASLQVTGRTAMECKTCITAGQASGLEAARNYQITNYMAFKSARRAFDIRDVGEGSYIQARIEDWGRNPDGTQHLTGGVDDTNAAFFSGVNMAQINLNISHRNQAVNAGRPAIQFSGTCHGNTVTGSISGSSVGIAETGGTGADEFCNHFDVTMVDVDTHYSLPAETLSTFKTRVMNKDGSGVITGGYENVKSPFPTRTRAVAAIAAGWVPEPGTTYRIARYLYVGSAGATAIADMPGLLPTGERISWQAWGGDPSGVTSSQAQLVAADAYCGANDKSLLIDGICGVTAPIDLTSSNIERTGRGKVKCLAGFTPNVNGYVLQIGNNFGIIGDAHVDIAVDGDFVSGNPRDVGWSPASGAFPAGALTGYSYRVTAAGTFGGITFAQYDLLVALVDAPSTTTYAANWIKKSDLVGVRIKDLAMPDSKVTVHGRKLDTVCRIYGTTERTQIHVSGYLCHRVCEETANPGLTETPENNEVFITGGDCGQWYTNWGTAVCSVKLQTQNSFNNYGLYPVHVKASRGTKIGGVMRTPGFGAVKIEQMDAGETNAVHFDNLSITFAYNQPFLYAETTGELNGTIFASACDLGATIKTCNGGDLHIGSQNQQAGIGVQLGLSGTVGERVDRFMLTYTAITEQAGVTNSLVAGGAFSSNVRLVGCIKPVTLTLGTRNKYMLPVRYVDDNVAVTMTPASGNVVEFEGQTTTAALTAFTTKHLGMSAYISSGLQPRVEYTGAGATGGWQRATMVDI